MKKDKDTPTRVPPSERARDYTASGDEASEPSEALLKEARHSIMETQARPSQMPTGEAIQGVTAAVWHGDKNINGLWSMNQNRNVYVAIADIGWKKLTDNSDSAIMAMTIILSHAFQTSRKANLREEEGQIRELYVW